jgi:hypothetical protein
VPGHPALHQIGEDREAEEAEEMVATKVVQEEEWEEVTNDNIHPSQVYNTPNKATV